VNGPWPSPGHRPHTGPGDWRPCAGWSPPATHRLAFAYLPSSPPKGDGQTLPQVKAFGSWIVKAEALATTRTAGHATKGGNLTTDTEGATFTNPRSPAYILKSHLHWCTPPQHTYHGSARP